MRFGCVEPVLDMRLDDGAVLHARWLCNVFVVLVCLFGRAGLCRYEHLHDLCVIGAENQICVGRVRGATGDQAWGCSRLQSCVRGLAHSHKQACV